MRSFIFEDRNDFPRMPDQNPYDEESGLFMNPIHQWSTSPYLGAVRDKKSEKWVAQIHIPQEIWEQRIRDNEKWHGVLADSFFSEKANNRSSIRVTVKDPRQAAWIVQSVLYGPNDTGDLIEDYLTARFVDGQPGYTAWAEIYREMPKFQGAPLVATDAEAWFAKHKEQDKQTKLAKNTEIANAKAPEKIKQGIINWITRGGNRKKIFGSAKLTLNQLGAVIDRAIERLGVQYFMQGINVKDPAGFDLRQFVGESIEESTRLDQDFEADLRKYKSASGEERSKLEKKWGKRSVHFKESITESMDLLSMFGGLTDQLSASGEKHFRVCGSGPDYIVVCPADANGPRVKLTAQHVSEEINEAPNVRTSYAFDILVDSSYIVDTVVSRSLIHGVANVDNEWFDVKVQPISDEDVDAFFPSARNG